MERFADRVRKARKDAGLTQKQLAAASGLSQTTISDIERGRNETSADVVALARALKVLAEWLADGKGPRSLAEATNTPETASPPSPAVHEVRAGADLEQMSVEARARILVDQAAEVASLWMALPPARRAELLRQLREAGGPPPGEARTLSPRQARGATPDRGTKGRRAAG